MSRLVFQVGQVLLTLLFVGLAILALVLVWRHYEHDPWTRDGKVQADIVQVAPDVTGLVTRILVHDNQPVVPGQTLFVVDNERYTAQLAQAEANIASARAQLNNAVRERARYLSLGDLVSQEVRDERVTTVEQDQAALVQARASLDSSARRASDLQAEANRERLAEVNMERSAVRAGVNGYITGFSMRPGDYVAAGQPAIRRCSIRDSYYVLAYMEETKLHRFRHRRPRARSDLLGDRSPALRVMSTASPQAITDRQQNMHRGCCSPTSRRRSAGSASRSACRCSDRDRPHPGQPAAGRRSNRDGDDPADGRSDRARDLPGEPRAVAHGPRCGTPRATWPGQWTARRGDAMNRRAALPSMLALSSMLSMAACKAGPDYRTPAELTGAASAPTLIESRSTAYDANPPPDGWWRLYGNPVLDGLIDQALRRNPDLRSALASLEQAQAALRGAQLQRTPRTTATVNPTIAQASADEQMLPEEPPPGFVFTANEMLSYDFDVAGRLRRRIEMARAQVGAQAAALDLARTTIAAETATAYSTVCATGLQIATVRRSVGIAQANLSVVRRFFIAGIVGSNDVVRARTQLEQTTSQLPGLVAQNRSAALPACDADGGPAGDDPSGRRRVRRAAGAAVPDPGRRWRPAASPPRRRAPGGTPACRGGRADRGVHGGSVSNDFTRRVDRRGCDVGPRYRAVSGVQMEPGPAAHLAISQQQRRARADRAIQRRRARRARALRWRRADRVARNRNATRYAGASARYRT